MSLEHDRLISMRTGLGVQIMPGDTSNLMGFRLLDSLATGISATDFDRRYLVSQIDLHQRMLAELQTLQRVARDEALRRQVADQMPVIEQHLARAQRLASDAGYTNGGP
jgi:predicted outer membrane protein